MGMRVLAGRFFFLLCVMLAVVWPFLLSGAGQAQELPPQEYAQRILSLYVRPNTDELTRVTAQLASRLEEECKTPERFNPAQVKADFDKVMAQWAYVELLRFGPVVEDNRFERFFMWPDSSGRAAKQVRAVVSRQDTSVLSAEGLSSKSVILQGAAALEYVLFDPDTQVSPSFQCGYAHAVAVRLNGVAMEIAAAWQPDAPFGRAFAHPGPKGLYHSSEEITAEIIKALTTGLKYTRDTKLLPALGRSVENARYQRAALWRSQNSLRTLVSTVDAFEKLYQAAGFGELMKDDRQNIHSAIVFEFEQARKVITRLADAPVNTAFTDPVVREDLAYFTLLLGSLNSRITRDLAPELGLGVGFNALDGD